MKICPSCGIQSDTKDKFCSKCGYNLSSKAICPYCNKEIKPNDTYCNNCGKSLKEEEK